MSRDYFSGGAGAIIRVKGGGASAFKVAGWPRTISGALITIDSIDPTRQDIAVPVTAADNFRVMYTFGKTFGDISVSGRVFFGCAGSGSSVMRSLESWFERVCISSAKRPVNVSIAGGAAYKTYFVGMRVGSADAEKQLMHYSFVGVIAPTP